MKGFSKTKNVVMNFLLETKPNKKVYFRGSTVMKSIKVTEDLRIDIPLCFQSVSYFTSTHGESRKSHNKGIGRDHLDE